MALPKPETSRMAQSGAAARLTPSKPPLLEAGDRLTRAEFERRYHAMPHVKKAERIEGVVRMPSPVRFERHSEPHAWMITVFGTYCANTPGVRIGDNATVRLDWDNDPQPDVALLIDRGAGGQTRISVDDYLEGAPELIVEIAASTASYDLHDKLRAYQRNGVREYAVWRVQDGALDWFQLTSDGYQPIKPNARGIVKSQVFPGLWINTKALLVGNVAKALADLQTGLQSQEHALFVKQLSPKRPAKRARQ